MTSQKPSLELTGERLPQTVFKLAWPVVLQEAAWTILSMIIMFFIGHLGAEAITAVGLSEQIIFIPIIAFAGISVGATAIVARHTGANEPEKANRTLSQAMLMAFILGIVFALFMWFFADQILWVFRASPEVIELGGDYVRANAPATVFFFIMFCGESILRGSGDTRTPMVVIVITEVIGTGLAFALINGFWIFPQLGVFGAGLARATSSIIGASIILTILIKGKGALKYKLSTAFNFDWMEIKRILRIGLPSFADHLQMRIAFTIYTIMISNLGTTVYAAHALAMRVEEFAFMPSFGFGMAATTMVGQLLGAKAPDLAKRAGYLIQRYCVIIMVLLGSITFIFSQQLIGIFVDDPEVINIGALGLRIWALAMPGMAINHCGKSCSR